MNGAFVHLVFNHIPVIALPFCFLLLAGGLSRQSRDIIEAALAALILTALLTIPAFKSGHYAAGVIRNIPGIVRSQIHEHAAAGDKGFYVVEILGVLALIGLWLSRKSGRAPKSLLVLILLGTLLASVAMARIAHLGGLIRHPEIESDFQPPASPVLPPGTKTA